MAQDKVQMPSSGAGITRYFDDTRSKLSFPPELVVIFTILVFALVVFLNVYAAGLFGL